MTPLEVLTKELGYTKISESETLVIFERDFNGYHSRLGIGKLIGISLILNGREITVDPFTLVTCVNFMLEKKWINLSKCLGLYVE